MMRPLVTWQPHEFVHDGNKKEIEMIKRAAQLLILAAATVVIPAGGCSSEQSEDAARTEVLVQEELRKVQEATDNAANVELRRQEKQGY